MAKKCNSLAVKGGFGFAVALGCLVGFAGTVGTLAAFDALTIGRFCLYGIAFGTVGGIAYPEQESGDAFFNCLRGSGDDEN